MMTNGEHDRYEVRKYENINSITISLKIANRLAFIKECYATGIINEANYREQMKKLETLVGYELDL